MSSNQKIIIKDINKSFGNNHVLRGVNLEVKQGESLVIIGGSGSGKSVLLKCILGLINADSGSIKIDDQEMVGAKPADQLHIRKKCGMLFQAGALFDSLPVWENICFALLQRKEITSKDAPDFAIEKLKAVGLGPDSAFKLPAELSGGMQKRVALARAIAVKPEIIFFDEPTTGLDPIMADVINELIVKCVKEIGATAITITHDMASVRSIADRVSMLYKGQMIWTGPIHEMENANNAYVDQFIHGRAIGPIEMVA